ncbi:MAG: YerC/YecD family TrpR-related protein [Patescibacteria group bacterium]|nr:YerC/YecD family TrpR-related protein [Patescibacteria group bacterium]
MEKFKFNKKTDKLFKAIISLKTVKEAESFFCDLCTIDEIREMSERWQIARMVNIGLPYREIAKKLGVSTTTVARVALWLNNGAGGYRLMLDRQNSHHNSSHAFKKS